MNGATAFINWLLDMGYLNNADIAVDGMEIKSDLDKIREVAPKFYNMLMCMCNGETV